MSAIIGSPQEDFRDQNPVLGSIGAFKKTYDKHTPKVASMICWSMFMIEEADSKKNVLAREIDKDARVAEVKDSYYDKIDIESEEYKALVKDYFRYSLTKEEAMYNIYVSKMEDLTMYIRDLNITVDKDFEKYIKISSNLSKMWSGLSNIKDAMDQSNAKAVVGNVQLSAREKRRMK